MFLAASGSISRFPARLFSCSPQFRQSLCVGHCAGYCATQGSAIRHPFPVLKNTRRILSTFSRCAKISGPPTSQIFWGHRGGCFDSHRRFSLDCFPHPPSQEKFTSSTSFASGVSCFLASGASGPTRKPICRQGYSAYLASRSKLCFLMLPNLQGGHFRLTFQAFSLQWLFQILPACLVACKSRQPNVCCVS